MGRVPYVLFRPEKRHNGQGRREGKKRRGEESGAKSEEKKTSRKTRTEKREAWGPNLVANAPSDRQRKASPPPPPSLSSSSRHDVGRLGGDAVPSARRRGAARAGRTALAPKTASTRIQPNRPASSPIESGPNAATSHGLVSTPVNEEYSYGRRPLVAIWAILASLASEPGSGPGE